MPIPPMVRGVLPPGTHLARLDELFAVYDVPGSNSRPALGIALRHATILIWSRDSAAIVYGNGSFVNRAHHSA